MKTTRPDYDYAPLSASRSLANFTRWKIMPFGNLEQGPGIVWLLGIWLRHRFGRALARFKFQHKKHFDRLVKLWHKLINLFRK